MKKNVVYFVNWESEIMKPRKAPSHRELVKPYLRDERLRKKIETGIQHLRVISQIIQLRKELGFTQAALAQKIKVSQPYIACIENDEASNLSLETLLKIVEALDGEVEIHIRAKKAA